MCATGRCASCPSLWRVDHDHLDVARERVRLHLSRGLYDAALQDVEQALASAPDDAELQRLRVVALLDSGRSQWALDAANHALVADPDDSTLHLLASMALSRLGHHGDAVAAAGESSRLAPFDGRDPHARAHLTRAHHGRA